ncbi:MAG: N-acetylmuramoyl-L-alanine amidase [Actinocatenispora sp.]
MRLTPRFAAAAAAMVGAVLLAPFGATAHDRSDERQAAFTAAADEFGVPASVLLAVSYQESRWEAHHGTPSSSGAYGPMALTDVPSGATNQRGDGVTRPSGAPSLHTLDTAADLLGLPAGQLRSDDATNIRGGAALLAQYARKLNGDALPSSVDGWYGAVARYSGSGTENGAKTFAGDVYGTIRAGAATRTQDGQQLSLAAKPSVKPETGQLRALKLTRNSGDPKIECPHGLDCDFVPAAYALNSEDKGDYGNYDIADRPHTMKVDTIVLHDTEETFPDTLNTFTNPASYVSAHYVVRSSDGHVTQMVPTSYVAWQAGNWYINMHSVGIEQEGFAIQGATWYTESLYHSTARLVRYLAAKYDIPLDRTHIIGHDNVPGINAAGVAGMHWDPGPFWNWSHFMTLLGRPIIPTGTSHSPVVTINPAFSRNVQQVTDCEQDTDVQAQGTSFVWLRTAPSADAPLYNDKGLHPDGTEGTTCAADWGDKASAGQQFGVAERKGDWTAIWWEGDKVWFHSPRAHRAVTNSSALVVRPKAGKAEIPTYGRAYPEEAAYPSDIPVQTVTPLQYTIKAGQSYVYGGKAAADYYYAKTIDASIPHDRTDVVGQDRYLRIQLGHRIAFVKAADVDVVPAIG